MKRFGNLYDKVCDLDNLYLAYSKARKGKSKSYGVIQFEKELDNNLLFIQRELLERTYRTSEYDVFMIHDPKERTIYRLPFRDRIVHHAVMNILEDIWTPVFISHTYSCIRGKGIHGALIHLKRDLKNRDSTLYCLKMDIKKFYPSVDHEILKYIIRKRIKDKKLLSLLDEIIGSAPGIPIGNYLSQFFANLYLSYFDHWLKEEKKARYYYRYADDMVLLSQSKDIGFYLKDKLRLDLKENYQVFPVADRGIDFVGYVFFHSHILMRKTIKKNFCRKTAKINHRNMAAKDYRIAISPWIGWSKHCNSRNLIKKITRHEEIF